MNILITGSEGFIGKNLRLRLQQKGYNNLFCYDLNSTEEDLEQGLSCANVIFHLAGVNRPQNPDEFKTCNVSFTEYICNKLIDLKKKTVIVFSSSIQAELDNPYGKSKLEAENVLKDWANKTGNKCIIFRLKNVFGKWCKPNYNSVVATFCYNIAHGLPIQISDPQKKLELVYIDNVLDEFEKVISEVLNDNAKKEVCEYRQINKVFKTTLGELASLIQSFHDLRKKLTLPDFSNEFVKCLYSTFISYMDSKNLCYNLPIKEDNRGVLSEIIKSKNIGQVFISRTKPGVTRGNHFHNTKTEKFLVIEGEGIIRLRHLITNELIEYRVSGKEWKIVDIPPGYTHSIENIGNSDMVTLFWANEIFNPEHPDTFQFNVL
ncbi:MAG: NAD-dependent epimerase/dehydratase family protein [Candidatus Bilamarchaeaceae archaeon]